jgi:hypothetical protein
MEAKVGSEEGERASLRKARRREDVAMRLASLAKGSGGSLWDLTKCAKKGSWWRLSSDGSRAVASTPCELIGV